MIEDILTEFQTEIMRWCEQDIKDSRPAYYKARTAIRQYIEGLVPEKKITPNPRPRTQGWNDCVEQIKANLEGK